MTNSKKKKVNPMTPIESNPMQPHLFWTLKAKYKDGSIYEDPENFVFTVNRKKIALIGLFYKGEYRGTIEFLDPIQRPILVRRTQIDLTEQHKEIGRRVFIVVGWQSTVGGRNVKSILELHSDGSIVMKNNDRRP